jgi:hypothetical protein
MQEKKKLSLEEIEVKISGGEPKFVLGQEVSGADVSSALNWYNQNRDTKLAYKYIADYVKKHKLKVTSDSVSSQSTTFGFMCRILQNGATLNETNQKWFDERLSKMTEDVVDKVAPTNFMSIQDRIAEKTSEIVGELEGAIDDIIVSGFTKQPSPYAIMQDKAKGVHANRIVDTFKRKRVQYDEALTTTDEQLIEGWSCFTKPQIKKLVAFCDLVITDSLKIVGSATKLRKPKKRKQKSPDQLVARLSYQQAYAPSDLKSEDPKKIIGAQQLWVYNTKTKKLGAYVAEDASGLSVRGSTIVGYSEAKSIMKTLRKPDEIIPQVINGGKVYLRNVINDLSTKESMLSGRVNTDTILLKIL